MTSQIFRKNGYNAAKLWRDALYNASTNTCPVMYVYIGNHVPYANESSPDSIVDTISTEKLVWDNIIAAKRTTGNDVELVVPRVYWTANTKYRQYDDTIAVSDLVSTNTTQNLKPMYVMTSDRNVYKCLSNNYSANSTVQPTGDYTTSNGNIATADGYIWKYMYNVKPSNKFLNTNWMPAPITTDQLDYGVSETGVVAGELTTIIVTDGGSGYYHTTATVGAFQTGCTILTLANTTNVAANMTVTGTGILSGTYISSVDTPNNKITISSAASANGGGSGNNLSILTRVYIDGDGTGTVSSATVSGGNVSKVTVTTIGTGYTRANAYIYGSGTGANARVVISPSGGHAKYPAKDLAANSTMFSVRIGEIDSTENGLISSNTSFRQYGLLLNPNKYGQSARVTVSNANSVISQTTDVTIVAGALYNLDEFVYQGTANNATAYGYVNYQTANEVRLTKVTGTITPGLNLIGESSGVTRTVVRVSNPDLQPYTGDILYAENFTKVDREDGQAENIKIVLKF